MEKLTQTGFGQAFLISIGLTLGVYVLRGFGFLSMMPGFVLLGLIILSFGLGLILSIKR